MGRVIYALMGMFIIALFTFLIIICLPSNVEFHVTEAHLEEFNLNTNNNTLFYNLKLNITARNPNKKVIVYYRAITAIAYYKDNDFASITLAPFDQGHKNTTMLQPIVFQGQSVIKLGSKQIEEYKEETRVGIYNDLAVDLDIFVKLKYVWVKTRGFNPPHVQCRRLSVPLVSNGKLPPPFSVTKCRTGIVMLT